jgi:hypothetical protein
MSPEFELPGVLIALVPAATIALSVYAWRWRQRRSLFSRAQSWPAADAIVNSSYELDENSGVLSRNTFTADYDNVEYIPLWSTAIQYSYHVNGEVYAGTYFLPTTSDDGHIAAEAGRAWVGRNIAVRYNPDEPEESVFLEQDGAPGKSRISRLVSDRPQLTTLSLK